ncbi:hypothetical protein [Fictibacillus macauensis]|nr:hypothetical protein [Fictibacillus macauensis]
MKEAIMKRHCEKCQKETEHVVSEDALEIQYACQTCGSETTEVKSFF